MWLPPTCSRLHNDLGDRPPSGSGWDFHRGDLCARRSRYRSRLPGDARHLRAVRRCGRLFGAHRRGAATAANAGHGLAGAHACRDRDRDGSLWVGAPRPDAPRAEGAAALRSAPYHPGSFGLARRRARSSDVGRHRADPRHCHADLAPALPHRISSARRRIGSGPAHHRRGGPLRHVRSRAVVLRTGRLPQRTDHAGALRARACCYFRSKHSDRRELRDLQFPALPVLRAHAHRQGATCNGRQSRRRPARRHPSVHHGRDSFSPGVGARGNLRHSHRTGDDALLRFRLSNRPESLRRRNHRRLDQLSGRRRGRDLRRAVRELRGILGQRAQGNIRFQRAYSYPDLAILHIGERNRGRNRGGRARGRGVMGWKFHIPLVLAIAFIVVAPAIFGSFTITLMNYIGIYAFAVLGLVLLTGVGGLTSFGQAAFVGIGAYATAWYTAVQGGSPWIGLLLALLLTGLVATVLGAATLRLGGHFLPLSTIAWGIAIYFLFGNIDALGRYSGLSGIPALAIGPVSLAGTTEIYFFIWSLLGIAMLLCRNLLASRQGRAIRSLRGGAAMVESFAINSFRMRLAVFVLAGLLAGLSGWLYAHMQRYISPAPFDIRASIDLLIMVLVGGAAQITGAVVGAAVIVLLKNALQDVLPAFTRHSAQFELVFLGLLFIVLLQKARGGIVAAALRFVPRAKPEMPQAGAPLPRRQRPAASDQPVLIVERARKCFGALAAVNDVSFELRPNELLALIGPNGAGKTTLLDLITGTAQPDAGRVVFLGSVITRLRPSQIAAKGMARTFQHVQLRPNMTLLENAMLGTY